MRDRDGSFRPDEGTFAEASAGFVVEDVRTVEGVDGESFDSSHSLVSATIEVGLTTVAEVAVVGGGEGTPISIMILSSIADSVAPGDACEIISASFEDLSDFRELPEPLRF